MHRVDADGIYQGHNNGYHQDNCSGRVQKQPDNKEEHVKQGQDHIAVFRQAGNGHSQLLRDLQLGEVVADQG